MQTSKQLHNRRKQRVRTSIRRTANGRPRLSVFRSGKPIYAQVIDDGAGKTLVAASSVARALTDKLLRGADKAPAAAVGKLVAVRSVADGLTAVTFNRVVFLFLRRVMSLAYAACLARWVF